jgi:hypothetical protein
MGTHHVQLHLPALVFLKKRHPLEPQQQGMQSLLPDFFGRIEGRHFGGGRRLLEQVGKAIKSL